nr:hypothetical protein GCM10020092_083480 [Actinoplanes digitatis]
MPSAMAPTSSLVRAAERATVSSSPAVASAAAVIVPLARWRLPAEVVTSSTARRMPATVSWKRPIIVLKAVAICPSSSLPTTSMRGLRSPAAAALITATFRRSTLTMLNQTDIWRITPIGATISGVQSAIEASRSRSARPSEPAGSPSATELGHRGGEQAQADAEADEAE